MKLSDLPLILKTYFLLRKSIHWSRDKLDKFQKKKLEELMKFLKAKSPYYSQLIEDTNYESFRELPVIDKAELMNNFNSIVTCDLDRDELIEFTIKAERESTLKVYRGEYSTGLSSGTSGNKTLTVLGRKERVGYGVAIFLRKGVYNLKRKRVLFALRTNNPAYMKAGVLGTTLFFVDYTHSMVELCELINQNNLNVIAAPPSLLQLLARNIQRIDHKIDWLVSYAEVLDRDVKDYLEKAFDSPLSQIYQGAEGFIAFTCQEGNLHLNEDLIHFEFEQVADSSPNVVNVIVTDLHRRTLPVIRYKMNDVVELNENPCECGSNFRTIAKIHGRKDNIFLLEGKNGTKYLFPDYVRRSINQASSQVNEFQAIQHPDSSIEIRLILSGESISEDIEQKIRENLRKYIGRLGAEVPKIYFTDVSPEVNKRSGKMIRVRRIKGENSD